MIFRVVVYVRQEDAFKTFPWNMPLDDGSSFEFHILNMASNI